MLKIMSQIICQCTGCNYPKVLEPGKGFSSSVELTSSLQISSSFHLRPFFKFMLHYSLHESFRSAQVAACMVAAIL